MDSETKDFFAGSLQFVDNYQAYIPNKINHDFSFNDNRIYRLLEEASCLLGKLNELSFSSEFYNVFTNIHVLLEALGSSEIEGTKADIKDLINVITYKDKDKISKEKDNQKITNLYSTTYNFFTDKELFEDVYSVDVLQKINACLFADIKPENTYAGKIRDFQNYIGGNNIMNAMFVPPPSTLVKELLEDLNNFWYNETYYVPNLIKIALYHFQFETIHPFVDGNGRMGRLLINLQLRDVGLLNLPVLCLSNYWKRNKGLYYEALTTARFSHDIEHWIRFFLLSIKEAGEERIVTIQRINSLIAGYSNKIKNEFKNSTHNMNSFLGYLVRVSPFVTVKKAQKVLGLTYQGANKIIDNFVQLGILQEISMNKRNREFVFAEYHDLVFNLIEDN